MSSRPPAEPATLADINLVNPWDTTGGANPLRFLIHDREALAGPNRILVFGADDALDHRWHGWQLQAVFLTISQTEKSHGKQTNRPLFSKKNRPKTDHFFRKFPKTYINVEIRNK